MLAIAARANGLGHQACISGQGDLPFKELLFQLICLGEHSPQVMAYGLEEEVDYYAPPFRFQGEDNNPWIPWRQMSETELPKENLDTRLEKEFDDAINQIHYVRNILNELAQEAIAVLN